MYSAQQCVEKKWNVVITVLEHATIVGEGGHTKYAKIHVVASSFVYTVANRLAVYLVLLVLTAALVSALMTNVRSLVQVHANRVANLARGVVLMASAIIYVEKNATAYHVMPPVPRGFLAATHVLVCVEKAVLLCVPFAMRKSFLPC